MDACVACLVLGREIVQVRSFVTARRRRGASSEPAQRAARRMQFEVFRQAYDVTLQPSTNLISPHFAVLVRNSNTTESVWNDGPDCLYRGHANNLAIGVDPDQRNRPQINAAFDVCHGVVINSVFINPISINEHFAIR